MTQPPTGPPQGPPPWGHYPPPPGPPPGSGRGMKIFGGVMIGGAAAILLPLMILAIASGMGIGIAEVIVSLLIVPIIGIGLLFGEPTRPWGLGILIGWAVALIVVGGSCVAIIASLNGSL
jgi:hypothetical protein